MEENLFKGCDQMISDIIETANLRKKIEDTPEVIELRKLRDEAYDKAREYQKQIDQKIMELHKTPNLVGHYIKFKNPDCRELCLFVSKVDRTVDGIKISTNKLIDFDESAISLHFNADDSIFTLFISFNDFPNIKIITEEEYKKETEELLKKII